MKLSLKKTLLTATFLTFCGISDSFAYPLYQNHYEKFIKAVRTNNYSAVRQYYRSMYLNTKDGNGNTALTYALKNDNYEIASFLMKNGANPYVHNEDGEPLYCDAEESTNRNIRSIFRNYDYRQCKTDTPLFDKKTTLSVLGAGALIGGVAALAGGGGGGGGGSGENGGSPTIIGPYGIVGAVNETTLNNILNINAYKGLTFENTFYSNASHYNTIRLAYSLARGYTGTYANSYVFPEALELQGQIPDTNPDTSTYPTGSVKVAVFDTGVNVNDERIKDNIVIPTGDLSNLAYKYCEENPTATECEGGSNPYENNPNPNPTYTGDDATWHGTAVANVIAGEFSNGNLATGIAPDATILPYRITFDTVASDKAGQFVNSTLIGEGFTNAVQNGAVVINNSWNVATLDENDNPSFDAENIGRAELDYAYSSMISAMRQAADDDVTFIFAAGNEGTAQSGLLSAIPLHYDEFQNDDGTYKSFINVVAYDSESETIANFSNRCGVTKQYCLTAPGADYLLSYYESGDLDNAGYAYGNGTSFAAPVVAGAYAVIKGAFPYLSASELTNLLFITARDIGAEGVDDIYGWGLLDLEAATRPVGAEYVPVDTRIDNRNYTYQTSSLKLTSSLASKIKAQNLSGVYLDSTNRTFEFNLNDKIDVIKDKPELNDMFDRFATRRLIPVTFAGNQELSFYSGAHAISRNSSFANEFKMAYNMSNTANQNYGFSFYFGNNPYNSFMDNDVEFYDNYALATTSNHNLLNPYFRNDSNENYGFNNRVFLNDKTAFNLGVLYQSYTPNTQKNEYEGLRKEDFGNSLSLISSVTYASSKHLSTTAEFGLMNERETLFGSQTSGAFGLGTNNQTYYVGLQNNLALTQKLSFIGRANFGYTKIGRTENSLVENVSNLSTNSFALGVNYALLDTKEAKSNISFIAAQTLNINKGKMNLRLPKARDAEGNLYYETYDINLKDKRSIDYQLSYNYQTANKSEFNAGLMLTNYTQDYNSKEKKEGIFMLNYIKAF
ncbi:MAG: S8 family serine peptidase [Alphaproteobacteria bacterium]|nr:S8 family serine peptidase [Alphaproteobacteria bacterium]